MCLTGKDVKICVKHNSHYVHRGNSNILHCAECRKENERNRYKNLSHEQRIKKRDADRKYMQKRRVENFDLYIKAQKKYRESDKFRDLIINKLSVKYSNLYCLKCDVNRVFGKEQCNDCNNLLIFINNNNYISICIHCNKEYGLEVKIDNRYKIKKVKNFCSVDCYKDYKKQKKIIYKEYYKTTDKYKEIKREIKRNGTHKKRVIKKGNKYQVIHRRILFQMFNYICQGCNIKCVHPNDINYNDDNCATIDHIKPVSKGGNHTYDNTQLLCRKCNTIKRDNEKYFEHKQKAKQIQLQFDLTISFYETGHQMSIFGDET